MRSMAPPSDTSARLQALGIVPGLLLGAVSAAVGLVPWLITGARLPLQNLWDVQTLPEQMPIALLPFSQYALTLLAALIVIGSTLAGCLARATRKRHARPTLGAIAAGVAVVQAAATVQTTLTVSSGLRESTAADIYLAALVAGTVAAILLGILVLLLIARAPRAGVAVGLSLAGVLAATWLGGLVLPFGTVATETHLVLLGAARWVPAVIAGLAVAWCGLGTRGQVFAALGSLLMLWIGPAALTALSTAAGTRVLASYPAEMAQFGAQVFTSALGPQGGSVPLVLLAALVMILGVGVRGWIQRRRLARDSRTERTAG